MGYHKSTSFFVTPLLPEANMVAPLTTRTVDTIKPGPTRIERPDGLLRGLYLVTQPSGAKSWAVRYRNAAGTPRKLTLGPYPAISLADARELAKAKLRDVQEGRDPAVEKQREKAEAPARTFAAVALRFIKRHAAKQNRTWAETARILGIGPDLQPLPPDRVNYLSAWSGRAIDSIRRRDVAELLDEIEDNHGRTMANRILAAIRALMNWYATTDDEYVSPIVKGMARGKPVKRDRTLSDDEIRMIWPLLDKPDFSPRLAPRARCCC